jgi:uncharacterized protein (TIGR04255 family)
MHFPEAERVIYRSNPLIEVVFQLRFARLLRIEQDPAAFQERVLVDYPVLKESVVAPIPNEYVNELSSIDMSSLVSSLNLSKRRAYDFVSTDGFWRISLTGDFVALVNTQYTRWEDFRARLEKVSATFTETYKLATFTRVGLRYKNVICRSKLSLKDDSWRTLLRTDLLGELVNPDFEKDTRHAARELVLGLDFDDARVRVLHGFVQLQDTGDEVSYLVDADFSREKSTEKNDVRPILDRFNREAGRLFRWCIERKLHEAMGPTAPTS